MTDHAPGAPDKPKCGTDKPRATQLLALATRREVHEGALEAVRGRVGLDVQLH